MQELKIKDIKRRFKNYEGRVGYEYPKNMFLFFEILSSTLSDTATLKELIFTIQLLVNDIENRKCGFHNSSVTREKFEELISKLKAFNDLPMVLSYVPRYIDEIADATFSREFSKIYGRVILENLGVEPQKEDYGYIEIKKDIIDISNKDKAEVLAKLYNNSHPMEMGMAQYDPTPMTVEFARKLLEKETYFSYLKGRPLYIDLKDNIIYVSSYNRDNGPQLAQQVISSCKNMNDIGKENLKKFETQIEEEIQKQIEQEIAKKHKEKLQAKAQQENTVSTASTRNHELDYLRVAPSELQPMRRLIEESGQDISEDTLQFIKSVENEAYPEEMKMLQDIEDVYELEDAYEYDLSELTIARNKDWYIIYGEDEESVEIVDIASLPTRDREASQEIHNYITKVINQKAHSGNKPVTLNAKEDTSYRMIQRMVNNGEYEIVEDIPNTWEDDENIKMHYLVLTPIMQRDRHETK